MQRRTFEFSAASPIGFEVHVAMNVRPQMITRSKFLCTPTACNPVDLNIAQLDAAGHTQAWLCLTEAASVHPAAAFPHLPAVPLITQSTHEKL